MVANKTLIHNATIVNEGRTFRGSLLIEGERIADIVEGDFPSSLPGDMLVYEAEGKLLLPGIIDTHVHFRDGGLSDNEAGTFRSESRAARAGGVTSVIDMPNTNPQTTSLEALEKKEAMAERDSAVNYGFMLGATNQNISTLLTIEPSRYAAIKLFLGSSTGNMLVDDNDQLDSLFREARQLIVAHCEDERIVQANLQNLKLEYQGTTEETAALHPKVRNTEACFLATYHAIERARQFGTRFHVAHITTATELSLLSNFALKDKHITAEVTPNHLWYDDRDYAELGNLIKCNPSIKTNDDRLALWAALEDGLIDTIATDHAPHPLPAKQKPYFEAPSGIPSIQHSLQMMLEAVYGAAEPQLELLPMIVQKMCHAPADLFGIKNRGYLRKGYFADVVLVDTAVEQTVVKADLLYRCKWSPLEGKTFHTKINHVWINGSDKETTGNALQYSK